MILSSDAVIAINRARQDSIVVSTMTPNRYWESVSDNADPVDGVVARVTVLVDENDEASRSLRVHVGAHDVRLENIREIVTIQPSKLMLLEVAEVFQFSHRLRGRRRWW